MNPKAKAIAYFGIALVLFSFLAYRAYQDITVHSDFSSLWVYGVATVFIAITCIPRTRMVLGKNLKLVRMAGWTIIAASIFWLSADSYFYFQDNYDAVAKGGPIGPDAPMSFGMIVLVAGILVLRIPKTVREIEDQDSTAMPNE